MQKPLMKQMKKALFACLPGLGILLLHLSLYSLMAYTGVPQALMSPAFIRLIDWMTWDPKLLIYRLNESLPHFVALAYSMYKRDWQGIKQHFKTMISVIVITDVLKFLVGRLRPDGSDTKSFPSGHSASVFAAAGFLHHRYGLLLATPVYFIASVVGCLRIYANKHYPSDVVAGAGIAILTAYNMATKAKPKQDVQHEHTPAMNKTFARRKARS